MKTNRKTIASIIAILVVGGLIGYLVGNQQTNSSTNQHINSSSNQQINSSTHQQINTSAQQIWTCSMHPQIRQNEPGDCPICGMDLIPLEDEQNAETDPMAVSMSATAMQLANIQTAIVGAMNPVKRVRLNGKVKEDERLVYAQASHIPGRIEQLMVNFTGEYVEKGQVIASVYSPELVTAQQELFEAQKIRETQPQLFNSAKEKLKNWKLTDRQIEEILQSGQAGASFDIRTDVSGYVINKMVDPGNYVSTGEAIYQIADLSKVWVLFDVYESDMPWIKKGDKVEFTVASLPGESFSGTISFLDPVIDPKTRVAKARVEVANRGLKLKPEMFVSGTVEAELRNRENVVVVPKTAVMWTGERSVVYVKTADEQGINFKMREVTLGSALGESYIIEDGLQQGEVIAVNGTFSIDAAAQLAGKPSMMNPQGGPVMTGHNHSAMDMGSDTQNQHSATDENTRPKTTSKATDTDPKFIAQLTRVYDAYINMKNAFVDTDAKKASAKAKDVMAAVDNVNMELLKGDAHLLWMDQSKKLNSALKVISQSSDIDEQRKAFHRFNQALYNSLKTFGLDGKIIYYQYCPMAFDNQGAYWLSEIEEIRNPYFGEVMLKCGETREVIK
ncbi:MAG: efflux RND transporter periplasmic adaptor subunit [Bacteroidales bacterium]|jgi:Cu(I)/Ag(I) efflux system membrane fusion protein|nr:efflux RND transporter periplasmic adaptor subunit [Bacteroidales bacterium]